MATIKKAQTGKNVPKGMVESEMFPGKMIPKSKSNYYNSNYSKMVEAGKGKPAMAKKKTPKAQGGALLRAAGKAIEKYSAKETAKETAKAAAKAAEADGFAKMRRLQRFEDGRIKRPLSKKDKEIALNYRNSPAGKEYMETSKRVNENIQRSVGNFNKRIDDYNSNLPKQKNGGMLKRADGSYSKRGLWDNIRANKGSGKKPTAAMLKQEKKIKAKTKK
jgi:hypothetical protein